MWNSLFSNSSENGSYILEFAKAHTKLMQQTFGADGSLLVNMTHTQFDTSMRRINEAMDQHLRANSKSTRMKLSEFSRWLDNYDASTFADQVRMLPSCCFNIRLNAFVFLGTYRNTRTIYWQAKANARAPR